MKQLIQAVNRHHLSLFRHSPLFSSSRVHFTTNNNSNGASQNENDTMNEAKSRLLEKEQKLKENLSEKDKLYYEASRLALVKSYQEAALDKNNWWNRIQQMTEEELDQLPSEIIKKYGTFVIKTEEMQGESRVEENYSISEYADQIKNLKKLQTNEDKQAQIDKQNQQKQDAIDKPDYAYTRDNYMQRQPRVDLSKHNYNLEQFKEYTQLYEEARIKDKEEMRQFYKMVKYSIANKDKNDKSAMAFARRFRLDLIQIPEEYKDESLDDIEIKMDKRTRRPIIRNRTSRDISKYDAWRVHDRELMKGGGKQRGIRNVMLSPALLIKAFGMPTFSRTAFDGSGEFDFEDNNLDIFNIADYRKTDMYWGFNREDEFYDKYLNKAPHKRKRKWPSVQQFWEDAEPQEFKLSCQDQADWRKFKVWIRKVLREVVEKDISFDQEIKNKYAAEIDICLGDYNEVGKVNHSDIGVFKYDFTYFMSEEALKKFPKEQMPEPLVVPKSFDLSKAERVYITKEELKRREMEEQDKMKNI